MPGPRRAFEARPTCGPRRMTLRGVLVRSPTLSWLRAQAVRQTLFPETTLSGALEELGFVQADPIRAPARAQDLILRQRVRDYRAGDLERHYPDLDLEEGLLYAYGFLRRPLWQLRHPPDLARLSAIEKKVLASVRELGHAHPERLRTEFGKRRVVNAWGQYSNAATLALERLHRRGLLRVVRRDNGIRVYAPSSLSPEVHSPADAFRRLLLCIVQLLAPVSETSLRAASAPLARSMRGLADRRTVLAELLRDGTLERHEVDGEVYLWPAAEATTAIEAGERSSATGATDSTRLVLPSLTARATLGAERVAVTRPLAFELPRRVRFLAPFDPVVWDRRRFEHLWGWAYRFEAYTPVARRLRGYYSLPLLWGDRVIGWTNLKVVEGSLDVELGFVKGRPRGAEFRTELEAEIERTRAFLGLERSGIQ
jgi:uncharacterized protein YcaQ